MTTAIEIRSKEGEARRLAALRTPEFRRRVSQISKLTHSNPEVRKRISEGTKQGLTPEVRAKMSQDRTGHFISQETKDKISKSLVGARKGWHPTEEHIEKIRQSRLGKKFTLGQIEKIRQSTLRQWQNPETRDRLINSLLNMRSPNKLELKVLDILNNNFGNEWKYVGNGELIIGGLSPDFVNTNGRKLIIEFFGRPWHKPQEEGFKQKVYAQFGYKTLIIWSEELADKEKLLLKIDTFLKGG